MRPTNLGLPPALASDVVLKDSPRLLQHMAAWLQQLHPQSVSALERKAPTMAPQWARLLVALEQHNLYPARLRQARPHEAPMLQA